MTDTTTRDELMREGAETTAAPSRSMRAWILGLVTLSIFMTTVSASILTIALPAVVRHFNASPLESTWLLLTPLMVTTCLLVTLGRVADMTGQRRMFNAGLVIFTFCAAIAGFSGSAPLLIGVLAIQAIGSTMVMANTGSIVGSIYGGPRLAWAMGIYLAGVSVGQLIGPTVGGLVADTAGWRWLFWAQVPLALICIVVGAKALKSLQEQPSRDRKLDIAGSVTLTSALALLMIGFSNVQTSGLRSMPAIVCLVGAVALIPVLTLVETRATDPILQFQLLRQRSFLLPNIANILSVMPRFATIMVAGLYFQVINGDSALTAGLKVIPMPVGITIGSVPANRIIVRAGIHITGITASTMTTVGLGWLAGALSNEWSLTSILLAFLVLGVGAGLFATVCSTLIINEAGPGEVGTVNGIRLTLQNLGGTIAFALSLAILTSSMPAGSRSNFYGASVNNSADSGALSDGFSTVFVVMIAVSLASGITLLAAQGRRHTRR
ncbi:MFS transporter [Rhodococcus pyridinivorans]|uniref:MFS transporter n=1 Tax=Rhodococcus pyridinivorans TaxID=103816 RepID=UPI001E5D8760|nr:MFS transporter [Rhodococcus pyridinivorans]MCD5422694.1 MFS transporter [Rhodococcus pyridinivorans]